MNVSVPLWVVVLVLILAGGFGIAWRVQDEHHGSGADIGSFLIALLTVAAAACVLAYKIGEWIHA